MQTKACIFDFDGVVIDSEKYHYSSWREIATLLGVELSYEEYMPFKSAGRKVVIPYLFEKAGKQLTPESFEEFLQLRTASINRELQKLNSADITAGLVEFVTLLKNNGILCAVASSSANAHETAKRFGLFDLFDAFVDGETGLPNKPAPDLFLAAAKRLGVEPASCVVFEDSQNGLEAAHRAQMHVVGIQTYFTNKADKIIDDFVGADLTLLQF